MAHFFHPSTYTVHPLSLGLELIERFMFVLLCFKFLVFIVLLRVLLQNEFTKIDAFKDTHNCYWTAWQLGLNSFLIIGPTELIIFFSYF